MGMQAREKGVVQPFSLVLGAPFDWRRQPVNPKSVPELHPMMCNSGIDG